MILFNTDLYKKTASLTASSVDLDYDGKQVHVTMLPNASHLEVSIFGDIAEHSKSFLYIERNENIVVTFLTCPLFTPGSEPCGGW